MSTKTPLIPATAITREEAVALVETKWWEGQDDRDVALAQLGQALLCMPFDLFHAACERAAGQPIWTHEFASPGYVRKLVEGRERQESPMETLDAIMSESRAAPQEDDHEG